MTIVSNLFTFFLLRFVLECPKPKRAACIRTILLRPLDGDRRVHGLKHHFGDLQPRQHAVLLGEETRLGHCLGVDRR